MKQLLRISICLFFLASISACKSEPKKQAVVETPVKQRLVPPFNVDNAYASVEKQLSFGHRYPGSEGQKKMISYISEELKKQGAKVYTQDYKVSFLGVKDAPATNIIGSFNPEATKRVMLCAHWDSRLIAEKDEDPAKQNDPIMGADDGATGTGALLEIARIIKEHGIDIGVDLVFFDAEDQGDNNEGWCLGSDYWGQNPHVPDYRAKYGILLDMIGAKGAQFGREANSQRYARSVMDKVWNLAQQMGYSNYFQDYNSGAIEDDHVHVMEHRKFPVIDIINRPIREGAPDFGHYHHTHKDDISIVDKNVMKAVGQVVTAVLYRENNGKF